MSLFRYIILLPLLLFFSFVSVAQDNQYIYQDTAIIMLDSVETRVLEAVEDFEQKDDEMETQQADTILRNNFLSVNPDSADALKNRKSFAYAKKMDSLLIAYQQSREKDEADAKNKISWLNRLLLSPITKYFFWILGLVFIFFILYKLFFTEGVFQRPYNAVSVKVLDEAGDSLLKATDYGRLISGAINMGNYRMAVRYHYLQSLQKLSSKGAIQLAADKTNYQYVTELTGKSYKNSFAALTLNYEYVWYGEFEINENIFNSIQQKFKQFNSGI